MNTDLERAHALSEGLVAARADHRRAEHALAVLLAELVGDQLFRPLGYASVEEFAADRLDLTARQTRDLVRVGRALPRADLDADTDALGDGDLLARIVEQWMHDRKEHTDDEPSPGHERYRITIEHCAACGGNQLADAGSRSRGLALARRAAPPGTLLPRARTGC